MASSRSSAIEGTGEPVVEQEYPSVVYLAVPSDRWQPRRNTELHTFDLETGVVARVSKVATHPAGYVGLVYRPDNGLLYAVQSEEPREAGTVTLVVIDPVQGDIKTHALRVDGDSPAWAPFLGLLEPGEHVYQVWWFDGGSNFRTNIDLDGLRVESTALAVADWSRSENEPTETLAFHRATRRFVGVSRDGRLGWVSFDFTDPEEFADPSFPYLRFSYNGYDTVFFSDTGVLYAIEPKGTVHRADLEGYKLDGHDPVAPTSKAVGGVMIATSDLRVTGAAGGVREPATPPLYGVSLALNMTGDLTARPGATVKYEIHVYNGGVETEDAVVVSTIPTQLSALQLTCGPADAARGEGTVSAAGDLLQDLRLAANSQTWLTLTGTIDPAFRGDLTCTSEIKSERRPNIAAQQSDAVTTTVQGATVTLDLAMTGPEAAVSGDKITYVITVRNTGDVDVPDAVVTGTIASQLSNLTLHCEPTGTASPGAGSATTKDGLRQPIGLPKGTGATITLIATIADAFTGTLTSTSTIDSPSHPDVGARHAGSVATAVAAPARVDALTRVDSLNGTSALVTTPFDASFTATAWCEGKRVVGAPVSFIIVEDSPAVPTGTVFADGAQRSTQATGPDGRATAPTLKAGDTPGNLTLQMKCQGASAYYSLAVVHK